MNDGDLTLTAKTEAAPREACGITLEPPVRARMRFPTHLTDWKVGLLLRLWPDKSVSTKAIRRELDLGARMLRHYARLLGLGHRPIGTYTERKVAWPPSDWSRC